MTSNITTQQMTEVQKVSGQIRAEMRIYHQDHRIDLRLASTTPQSEDFLKNFTPQFGETMATMLSQFFAIKGTIVNVGRQTKTLLKVKPSKDDSFNKLRNELRMQG